MSHVIDDYDLIGWFDGSCWVNPGGKAGWGMVLKDFDDNLVLEGSGTVGEGPRMSNNVAEHFACAKLLEAVAGQARRGWRVLIQGDSRMVVNQLAGRWGASRCKLYFPYFQRGRKVAMELRQRGVKLTFVWIPREQNTQADSLSR